ncbi:MAG: HTTM domain-containing protein [Flavobacteriales bacterium]|nr:HTTM domain-containing protein [Flavobacteriales bacterium]
MSSIFKHTQQLLNREVSIAPLVTVRLLFGLMMFFGTVRFISKDWVDQLYVQPHYFFHYYGFDWVKPLPENGMYFVFGSMAILALFVAAGFLYRISSLLFFMLFTYAELIDVTNYLNHYYFISIFSFLMALVPAHRRFSVDGYLWPKIKRESIPFWVIGALRFQLGIVYFFAGVAKLNFDWLFRAEPLRTWFLPFTQLPIFGKMFGYRFTAFIFSWAGALYDLSVPFLLSMRKTLPFAYAAVIGFHIITWLMFPIGMFPWVMIVLTWVFFPIPFHEKLITKLESFFPKGGVQTAAWKPRLVQPLVVFLVVHFTIQLLVPFRYLLYPGELFWTEQGFRFSWRVMLMEKSGSAQFYVSEPKTGRTWDIYNPHYLTPVQEKQMSTQPDLILQYAQILESEFQSIGVVDPVVTADIFVSVNGKRSKRYISNKIDLTKLKDGWAHKTWILDNESD